MANDYNTRTAKHESNTHIQFLVSVRDKTTAEPHHRSPISLLAGDYHTCRLVSAR